MAKSNGTPARRGHNISASDVLLDVEGRLHDLAERFTAAGKDTCANPLHDLLDITRSVRSLIESEERAAVQR